MASLRNSLSFGTVGDIISTSNTGGSNGDAFTQVVAGTTLKWSSTQTYLGGAVSASANGAEGVRLSWATGGPRITQAAFRGYFYLTSAPTGGNANLFGMYTSAGTAPLTIRVATSGVVRVYSDSAAANIWAPSTPFPLNEWVRVEYIFNQGTSDSTGQAKFALYHGEDTTPFMESGLLTGLNLGYSSYTVTSCRIGKGDASTTAGYYMSRVAFDHTAEYTGNFIGPSVGKLATPVVTITSTSNPTSVGGNDGTITASWPAVSGAVRYEIDIANGEVTSGFVAEDTNAVSPYTFTGKVKGVYTVAVRAMPS